MIFLNGSVFKLETCLKKLSLIIALLLTQSCLGGGSDYYRDRVEPFLKDLKPNYKAQVFDGVMEPVEFPDLEEDQKTLVGIDSNHDGVRDDMEIFINRNFKYDYERNALKGDFKRAPYYFEHYKNMTPDEKIKAESNHSEELSCLSHVYGYLKLPISPEKKKYSGIDSLYNTGKRKAALSHNYQALAGKAYGNGYGDKTIFPNCIKKIEEKYAPKK